MNWHVGFACAGVGTTLGLILYVMGRHNLQPAIDRIATAKAAKPVVTDAAPVSMGFTTQEWKRIAVIFMFFVFAAIFWAAYEQAASTLSLFADRYANRNLLGFEIPVSWYVDPGDVRDHPVPHLCLALGAPVPVSRRRRSSSRWGSCLSGCPSCFSFGSMAQRRRGEVSSMWLLAAYFLQVIGELCLSPVGNSVVTSWHPPASSVS